MEIRIRQLYDVVDLFVVLESNITAGEIQNRAQIYQNFWHFIVYAPNCVKLSELGA